MSKLLCFLFSLTLFVAVTPAVKSDEPSPIPSDTTPSGVTTLVPKGTLVVVSIRRSYKSYGLSTGSKVSYDVVNDVVVNGQVVIKAGDVAEGEILNAHEGKSGTFFSAPEGANLRLSVDKVFNFCGDTLETDFARSEFRNKQGFLGGKKDVEVSKGQKYAVPTERAQKVCSSLTSETPAPVPDDALPGDKD